jgi:hypothetical protein
MRKYFCLSKTALELLQKQELKLQLMLFFEVKDARTIETYINENVPNGPLMNICVRELIHEYAPFLNEKDIYRRLTDEELDELNKTKQEIRIKHQKATKKGKYTPKKTGAGYGKED